MTPIDFKKRQRRKPKKTLRLEAQKAINSLLITLTVMIFALGLAFLITTNTDSQKDYSLEQQRLRNENLKTINVQLVTKITQATAFSRIETDEKLNEMVSPEDRQYVTREDNLVE